MASLNTIFVSGVLLGVSESTGLFSRLAVYRHRIRYVRNPPAYNFNPRGEKSFPATKTKFNRHNDDQYLSKKKKTCEQTWGWQIRRLPRLFPGLPDLNAKPTLKLSAKYP